MDIGSLDPGLDGHVHMPAHQLKHQRLADDDGASPRQTKHQRLDNDASPQQIQHRRLNNNDDKDDAPPMTK
ncbi:hypothetical protein [Absidia glauca]|uniref:Uncharacterized protein n=1 Tax=Absidia glauca TaxID=4829 RepID=A0A163L1M9_ABSGL|nr:hypothetical protein [Absidia glauca]